MRSQQLRTAVVLRSTVADVETAELVPATPEQVDAAVAAPTEGTIAVNAEQRSGGGRGRQGQGRQGGGGRRAPRVPIESIQVGQELDGIVVRLMPLALLLALLHPRHWYLLLEALRVCTKLSCRCVLHNIAALAGSCSCCASVCCRKTWLTSAASSTLAAGRTASSTFRNYL